MSKRKSMSGFLVVTHLAGDTIPVRLCATREEAHEFIAEAGKEAISAAIGAIYQRNTKSHLDVVSMAVIDFRDGEPMDRDVVRDWEDEPVKAKLERVWRDMGIHKDKDK